MQNFFWVNCPTGDVGLESLHVWMVVERRDGSGEFHVELESKKWKVEWKSGQGHPYLVHSHRTIAAVAALDRVSTAFNKVAQAAVHTPKLAVGGHVCGGAFSRILSNVTMSHSKYTMCWTKENRCSLCDGGYNQRYVPMEIDTNVLYQCIYLNNSKYVHNVCYPDWYNYKLSPTKLFGCIFILCEFGIGNIWFVYMYVHILKLILILYVLLARAGYYYSSKFSRSIIVFYYSSRKWALVQSRKINNFCGQKPGAQLASAAGPGCQPERSCRSIHSTFMCSMRSRCTSSHVPRSLLHTCPGDIFSTPQCTNSQYWSCIFSWRPPRLTKYITKNCGHKSMQQCPFRDENCPVLHW